jgi:prepilin-type N-terminal cleavage/methylation domain-containing protein
MNKLSGFTLIEVSLVIAIMLVVGFLSEAFPLQLISQMSVRDSASEIRGVLWKAEMNALAGREHSSWGVHYDNSTVSLFKGDSYVDRDQSFDENTKIDEKIQVSDWTDAIFVSPSGRPQEAVSEISLSWNESHSVVSINSEGVIE